jgi:hypothetical protein
MGIRVHHISHHIISCRITSFINYHLSCAICHISFIISFHVISFHVMSFCIILYHTISYHIFGRGHYQIFTSFAQLSSPVRSNLILILPVQTRTNPYNPVQSRTIPLSIALHYCIHSFRSDPRAIGTQIP